MGLMPAERQSMVARVCEALGGADAEALRACLDGGQPLVLTPELLGYDRPASKWLSGKEPTGLFRSLRTFAEEGTVGMMKPPDGKPNVLRLAHPKGTIHLLRTNPTDKGEPLREIAGERQQAGNWTSPPQGWSFVKWMEDGLQNEGAFAHPLDPHSAEVVSVKPFGELMHTHQNRETKDGWDEAHCRAFLDPAGNRACPGTRTQFGGGFVVELVRPMALARLTLESGSWSSRPDTMVVTLSRSGDGETWETVLERKDARDWGRRVEWELETLSVSRLWRLHLANTNAGNGGDARVKSIRLTVYTPASVSREN